MRPLMVGLCALGVWSAAVAQAPAAWNWRTGMTLLIFSSGFSDSTLAIERPPLVRDASGML